MKRFWRHNGLSVTLLGFFLVFLVAQGLTGWRAESNELKEHHRPGIGLGKYLTSGAFLEATMENWESEFLQMAAYVIFTTFLYQRGSAESKDPEKNEAVDRDPRESREKIDAPGPVRAGGWRLWLYERSLSFALLALFLISFILHGVGGAWACSEERALHGEPAIGVLAYMRSSAFWFESFQNWQSEFLAIGAMVVLSIFLRQRGSAESKPVDSPHHSTGSG
ncbi:MAG: DUF6766 family protein [Acidobacteriota bacterium]